MKNFKHCLVLLLLCPVMVCSAQEKYFTKTGKISFLSNAPLEDIEAVNKTAGAVLDTKTGVLQFALLMKGFEFKKALMQEHFNENYVESNQYPKAEFRGAVVNNSEVNYATPGTYLVKVKGQLTIHGVTKELETSGTLQVANGSINATASFPVVVSDYRISIPSIVKDKVSNNVKIMVEARMQPLK